MLNFGQNAIFTTSLVALMLCASTQITAGRFSVVAVLIQHSMDDSSYSLNFDQGKKNEIQHHS